jgi:hypothetical protein
VSVLKTGSVLQLRGMFLIKARLSALWHHAAAGVCECGCGRIGAD